MAVPPIPAEDPASAYAKYLRETKGILDIRTIHQSGVGSNYLDVVVVSAGFTADQMGDFHAACEKLAKTLLSKDPWLRYRKLVNIHAVFVGDESVESSRLKVMGYKGNILGCDNGIAVEYSRYAAKSGATVVLHNSAFSTAATGTWGVLTLNKSNTVNSFAAAHELGHGFAGLGDEYIQRSDPFVGDPGPLEEMTVNVTAYENPRLCKWHYWVDEEWPGLFGSLKLGKGTKVVNSEGAGWVKGIYRPEVGCIMRGNRDAFCAVCNEGMETNFFRYVDLFTVAVPAVQEVVVWKGESVDFHVRAIDMVCQPPEWLKSRLNLYVDGQRVASSDVGDVAFQLHSAASTPGIHQVGANLDIQSDAVRRDFGFMSRCRGWRVKVIPYEKPSIILPPRPTVASDGSIDVPIAIKHSKPALFTLKMAHAPVGAVLDQGRFKWKPSGQTGSWKVDFSAFDEQQNGVVASMEISVKRADKADGTLEVQSLEPIPVVSGKQVKLLLKASAKDGGHLLFEPVQSLDGVELNSETGELSWSPLVTQAGPQSMRFRVKNGLATHEIDVLFWVRREATPSPVSYANQYKPQTIAALEALKQSPVLYQRIFETLRLLRDRYAPIHQKALIEAKGLYEELPPKLRENCLQDLQLHAWEFANKPIVLEWMRGIATGGKSEVAVSLLKKLDQIDSYNAERIKVANAEDAIRQKERQEALVGVVTAWQMSKIYTEENKSCKELVASVFPPETSPAPDAAWVNVGTFADGIIEIRNALERAKVKGPRENCAIYLRASIEVSGATDARLELGSDDGIKAWINGKEVFANPVTRGIRPGEDKVPVHFEKGANTLLLKITQGTGDWHAYARIRAADGTPIPNLKIGSSQ